MVISLRTCYMHSIVLSKVQRVIKIQTKGCNVDFQFWTITKYNLFYIHNFEYLGFRVNPWISNPRNVNLPFLSFRFAFVNHNNHLHWNRYFNNLERFPWRNLFSIFSLLIYVHPFLETIIKVCIPITRNANSTKCATEVIRTIKR